MSARMADVWRCRPRGLPNPCVPNRMTLAAIVCGIFMYRVERPRAVQLAGLQRLNSDRDKVLALFRDLRN